VGRSHKMQYKLTQITRIVARLRSDEERQTRTFWVRLWNLVLKCAFVRSRRKFGHSTRFPQEVCGHIHPPGATRKRNRLHPGTRAKRSAGESQMTSISEVPTRLGVQFDEGRLSNAKSIG